MGLKNMFKAPKDMSKEQSKEVLEMNGMITRNDADPHRRKFKFGEFSKFARDKTSAQEPLRPRGWVDPNAPPATDSASGSNSSGTADDSYDPATQSTIQSNTYGQSNRFASSSSSSSNPAQQRQNAYGQSDPSKNSTSYGAQQQQRQNGYGQSDPYSKSSTNGGQPQQRHNPYGSSDPYGAQQQQRQNPYGSSDPYASQQPQQRQNAYGSSDPYGQPPVSRGQQRETEYIQSDPYGAQQQQRSSAYPQSDPYRAQQQERSNGYAQPDPYGTSSQEKQRQNSYASANPSYSAQNKNLKEASHESINKLDPYGSETKTLGKPEKSSNYLEATTSTDPYKLQRETSNNSHAPTYQTYDPYGEQDPYSGQSQAELLIERQQQQQQQSDKASYVQQDQDLDFNSYPGASAANEYQSTAYDPYLDQQGWQEQQEMDEEEEEINRIRRQTKDVRDATVKSTQNILGHLRQADDTATNTMGALGAQREKMYEIESNLNIMSTQQRFVNEHVKELEHYNRSLFHIKASNPFTKKSRAKAAEDKFLAQRQADRDRDSSLNTQLYHSQNTIVDQLKGPRDSPALQSDLRDKYDYERRAKEAKGFLTEDHDEEDERMEVELSKNLDEAAKLTNNLKSKAQAISNEIISQNRGLKEISEKVNKVDDSVVLTTNRIRGI